MINNELTNYNKEKSEKKILSEMEFCTIMTNKLVSQTLASLIMVQAESLKS